MSGYNDFALFYDMFTDDVDYKKRTEYLCSLFKRFDKMPSLLLDMACGTGGFSLEFAKKGVQVIGVDPSTEMLMRAQDKKIEQGVDILFLCQTAAELELYGTVDGAVCCLDSLNHITDFDELKESFKRIALFLEKDRLFIFDMNTVYKHAEILADNCFVRETDEVLCVWQNEFQRQDNLTNIRIDIFSVGKDGKYDRFSDSFAERGYTNEQIKECLEYAGLFLEAQFEEMTENEPNSNTERIIYVTRKG